MNAYVLRPDETAPPPALQHMWTTVVRATQEAVRAIKPGVICSDIDAVSGRFVRDAGYEEWSYETGHSVGAWIHGIGPTLGPKMVALQSQDCLKVRVNDSYAVEPAVEKLVTELGTILRMDVQEMVLVTAQGAQFMVPPQTDLMLIEPDSNVKMSPSSQLERFALTFAEAVAVAWERRWCSSER